jgi:hypothetical protein
MKKVINKKRISAVVLFLMFFTLSSLQLLAQKKEPSEFTAHAAGAFSTYLQPAVEGTSVGYNSDFGIGFNGFFNQQVGIHLGIGLGFFNIKSTVTNIEKTKTSEHGSVNGFSYDLHTTLSGYTETHKSMFLSVPVMFIFQTQKNQQLSWRQSKKPSFYLMGGAKALLLFNNKYEAKCRYHNQ